jgi:DNA ligase-1
MLLAAVADTSRRVEQTSGRRAKARLLASALRFAPESERDVVVRYLMNAPRQRRLGVGPASLRALPEPSDTATLGVTEVDAAFSQLADTHGPGAQQRRHEVLQGLLGRATASEQRLLVGLVTGELRQGAGAGVMVEAAALASSVPLRDLRRAVLVTGSLPDVVVTALQAGAAGVADLGIVLGSPMAPMLAGSAASVSAAVTSHTSPSVRVEQKLDGIRIQAHRWGEHVRVFSRSGEDLTARMPEVVDVLSGLRVGAVVLDGEAQVVTADGRPAPFAATGSRVGRHDAPVGGLCPYFFDLLHLDGADRFDEPLQVRQGLLADVVPSPHRVRGLDTSDPAAAEEFYRAALAEGHEGVLVKATDQPYTAGRRGSAWVKVKPRVTLDLLVVAAEWGHGRRHGQLSNIHLAAVDTMGDVGPVGAPVMLGKTFKGMTDEVLAWQTTRFLELAAGPTSQPVVRLRPAVVAEVAIDGVQSSTRYPGGVTLRFARLLRYREDKRVADVAALEDVRALLTR